MLVLASSSPRRRELMALLGVPFRVTPSQYQEPPPPGIPVALPGLVTSLATEKALEVADRVRDSQLVIIGADTLVTTSASDEGMALGKPSDTKDAVRMLEMLAGKTHFVYTGIALAQYSDSARSSTILASSYVRTSVTFKALSSAMIEAYVLTGEPMDKAGAYGAQGYAAPFISEFHGDFYNVVGLPLCALGDLLEASGVIWWQNRSAMPPIIG